MSESDFFVTTLRSSSSSAGDSSSTSRSDISQETPISGPPQTRTLTIIEEWCDFTGDPECERWAVPLTTFWSATSTCDPIIPASSPAEYHLTCAPPGFEQVFWNDGYYSPGVCPSGYTVGCRATSTALNYETIRPAETAGICVPIDFDCEYWTPEDGEIIFWATTVTQVDGNRMTASVPGLQIRWQPTDLVRLPAHPLARPTVSNTPTPDPSLFHSSATGDHKSRTHPGSSGETGSGGGSGSGDGSSSASGRGLSNGAIAGMVVGIVAGLSLLGLGVFFLWRHLRRKKAADRHMLQYMRDTGGAEGAGGPAELGGRQMSMPMAAGAPAHPYQTHDKYGPISYTTPQEKDSTSSTSHVAIPVSAAETPQTQHTAAMQNQNADHLRPSFDTAARPISSVVPQDLMNGNDLEVAPVSAPVTPRLSAVASGEVGEEWERQQLIQEQSRLAERRNRLLEIEQIEKEEAAIRQRLSQLPRQ